MTRENPFQKKDEVINYDHRRFYIRVNDPELRAAIEQFESDEEFPLDFETGLLSEPIDWRDETKLREARQKAEACAERLKDPEVKARIIALAKQKEELDDQRIELESALWKITHQTAPSPEVEKQSFGKARIVDRGYHGFAIYVHDPELRDAFSQFESDEEFPLNFDSGLDYQPTTPREHLRLRDAEQMAKACAVRLTDPEVKKQIIALAEQKSKVSEQLADVRHALWEITHQGK